MSSPVYNASHFSLTSFCVVVDALILKHFYVSDVLGSANSS